MELRTFLQLNEGMALRAVLDSLQAVEAVWSDEDSRRKKFEQLLEILTWSNLHSSAKVKELARLPSRIPHEPSYHQFMSLVAPIERAYGRGVSDGEMTVKSQDRERDLRPKIPLVLVVDNLRSAFNVGSIFRTAECFGVDHLYLCGYTAKPDQDKLKKAAMGTDSLVKWTWHARAEDAVRQLKDAGYRVFALETSGSSILLDQYSFQCEKTALVFGNERFGIESSLLQLCDGVLEIPCQGQKNSLNVALSLGIAVYEWRKQFLKREKSEQADLSSMSTEHNG